MSGFHQRPNLQRQRDPSLERPIRPAPADTGGEHEIPRGRKPADGGVDGLRDRGLGTQLDVPHQLSPGRSANTALDEPPEVSCELPVGRRSSLARTGRAIVDGRQSAERAPHPSEPRRPALAVPAFFVDGQLAQPAKPESPKTRNPGSHPALRQREPMLVALRPSTAFGERIGPAADRGHDQSAPSPIILEVPSLRELEESVSLASPELASQDTPMRRLRGVARPRGPRASAAEELDGPIVALMEMLPSTGVPHHERQAGPSLRPQRAADRADRVDHPGGLQVCAVRLEVGAQCLEEPTQLGWPGLRFAPQPASHGAAAQPRQLPSAARRHVSQIPLEGRERKHTASRVGLRFPLHGAMIATFHRLGRKLFTPSPLSRSTARLDWAR